MPSISSSADFLDHYQIDIQRSAQLEQINQIDTKQLDIPADNLLITWATYGLKTLCPAGAELSIRIVDEQEIIQLNTQYRAKNKPTNVLSFPARVPEGFKLPVPLLGDVVLCAPVIQHESNKQVVTVTAHWAHLLLHGILHLCGFDHQTEAEAVMMEQREVDLLAELGFANPYLNH